MKKYVRYPLLALCALAILAGLAAAGSHLMYGRSLKASVYEMLLRRRFATTRTAQSEIERLEARRTEPEPECRAPGGLASPVAQRDRSGMRVFTLGEGNGGALVLYLHGGAYINSFNAYQWRFMDRLTRQTGCETVAPAYHLAPWADYARAYEDLSGLYREILAENPGRRVIFMGDSAGGGLALGLAEYLLREGTALPERLILFSPWVDVSMDNPDIADRILLDPILHFDLVKVHGQYWAGGGDTRQWMVSPLFGDMAGLPPVTIYCGTRELLYPDLLLARDRLTGAGVALDFHVGRGMNHDYPLMPLPEAERTFREIAALVAG